MELTGGGRVWLARGRRNKVYPLFNYAHGTILDSDSSVSDTPMFVVFKDSSLVEITKQSIPQKFDLTHQILRLTSRETKLRN